MAFTNTKESGLEALIVKWLVEQNGYEEGTNADYSKEYAIDETRLFRFLQDTQPMQMSKLGVFQSEQKKRQFLNRLQGELVKRGIVDVLRSGIKVYPVDLIMFYLTPTENNGKAREMFQKNIFSVTRQLHYSQDAGKLALDLCLFINGLPVITFELKNQLTKQNVDDAVQQYKDDRDPREMLFQFKRCMVHLAVDDARIKFCTRLAGKDSWFLPFDKGYNDGSGNPPNPIGLMTDYLWKDILTKEKLTLIIENYAQVVIEVDEDTKKKREKQIFPRYHQMDVVTKLLNDVRENGVGHKYLIQHSAGSGKSNSIAWLAHQLIGLEQDGRPHVRDPPPRPAHVQRGPGDPPVQLRAAAGDRRVRQIRGRGDLYLARRRTPRGLRHPRHGGHKGRPAAAGAGDGVLRGRGHLPRGVGHRLPPGGQLPHY